MAGDLAIRASHATAGTLVSVYAAMLGFFAALNALSEPAAVKGAEIVKSIQASFSSGPASVPVRFDQAPSAQYGDNTAAAAMAILVDALGVPLAGPDAQGRYELVFADAALFAPAQPRLRADRLAALDSAMRPMRAEQAWQLSLMLPAGAPALPDWPLTQKRVDTLADHLFDMGWPAARFSVVASKAVADGSLGFRLHDGLPSPADMAEQGQ